MSHSFAIYYTRAFTKVFNSFFIVKSLKDTLTADCCNFLGTPIASRLSLS